MTILDLYRGLGLVAKAKTVNEQCGPCPLCGGRDRFTLFLEQGKDGLGRYWCRQCNASGDRIQFLRDFNGLDFPEACRELGLNGANLSTVTKQAISPPRQAIEAWQPRNTEAPSPEWQEKAAKLVRWAKGNLEAAPQVMKWLNVERGLSKTTIQASSLGWCPQDIYRPRTAWGLPPEIGRRGLPKRLWIPQGLVIPVFSTSGEIHRIKFRRTEGKPKYIPLPTNPKNTAPYLLKTQARPWVVVESELDALLLAQEAGAVVNVLALGSASYPPDVEANRLLSSAPIILLVLDYDEAGQKRTQSWWLDHFSKARSWPVPEGKDVCDAWQAGWPLLDWIEEGLPVGLRRRKPPPPVSAKQEEERPATAWQKLQGMLKDNAREGFRIVGDGLGGFYPVYPESWSIEMQSEAQALFNQSLDDLEHFATRFPTT